MTFDSFFLGYHKLDVSFLEFFSDRVSIECKHASIYIPSTLSCLLDDDNPLHEMTEEANVTARLYDAILELWTESMSCLSIEAHRFVYFSPIHLLAIKNAAVLKAIFIVIT